MLSLKGILSNKTVSNKLLIALSAVILTSIVQASPSSSLDASNLITLADASSDTSPESMLTPGAKLIAGDSNKNEFFIVGKDDKEPVTAANTEKAEVVDMAANDVEASKQETVTKVANAWHQAIHASKKEHVVVLPNVAKVEKVIPAAKKHVKVAAKKQSKHAVTVKVASKKKSMKSKMVAVKKPVHTKMASKKIAVKIKMALNGKKHKKLQSKNSVALGKPHTYNPKFND